MSAPTGAPKSGRRYGSHYDRTEAFPSRQSVDDVDNDRHARAAITDPVERSLQRPRVLRGSLTISAIAIAFLEVKCNLLKRALFPLLCLCQPKILALGIQQRPAPAEKFLSANFDQPVHELH